ncbi:hypothetical protein GCM10010973_37720 [Cribrihabitans marinus]|nr:hypothetical protein GCM10010973_37720 [Cribrihabitans marinus]
MALASGPVVAQDTAAPSFDPPAAASLNFYGLPGLMDMPSAEMMPDGQFSMAAATFAGQTRYTLAFQATPWLMASFRYGAIRDLNLFGFDTYYDRNFDVRFRLMKERGAWPELTLGLQDLAGTGIYSGEYIVATKRFRTAPLGTARGDGQLKLTAGLGWGRLGSNGSIGSTGSRPAFNTGDTGGELSYDQWFRGPVAPFAGIEWQANDRLGFKLEYSSDAYVLETRDSSVFERKSSVNFGVEYQATPRTRLGAYYMYGSSFGLGAQIQLNPKYPVRRLGIPAPQPVAARPDRTSRPQAWDTGWAASAEATPRLRDQLEPVLLTEGLVLESLAVEADRAELRYRNTRYRNPAVAMGRAARALARVMPASVETFRLVPVANGMGLSEVTLRRSDLEALEFDPQATDALRAVTGIGEAAPRIPAGAATGRDLYPDFSWSVAPYFSPAYFDPDQPFRIDVGADLNASYRPAPGWLFSGTLRQRVAGNVKGGKTSGSALPPVRTDQVLFAQEDTTLNNLYAAYYWRPGRDLYARVTAGYFESAYGGLSSELLWKPVSSRLALGLEANYARKRDYDQRLGFQDYGIVTGHASAYMDLGRGFHAQVDAGRYLAGDWGATFGLDRVFDNGWSVGGFFTLTDVSAEEFGEGSFDKGIRFSIPLEWFLGQPSQRSIGTTIRPIQRDGGARVHVPGRLYGQVRAAHGKALDDGWPGVWE